MKTAEEPLLFQALLGFSVLVSVTLAIVMAGLSDFDKPDAKR